MRDAKYAAVSLNIRVLRRALLSKPYIGSYRPRCGIGPFVCVDPTIRMKTEDQIYCMIETCRRVDPRDKRQHIVQSSCMIKSINTNMPYYRNIKHQTNLTKATLEKLLNPINNTPTNVIGGFEHNNRIRCVP